MQVMSAKVVSISQAKDTKKAILDAVKDDLPKIDVMFNQILVGIYFRPEKTASGLFIPQSTVQEDQFQGKVGLVLKKGPTAFRSDDQTDFAGQDVEVGDWIVFRVGDNWELSVGSLPCRLVSDRNVRLKISDPSVIY